MNYYDILDVPRSATTEEVRRAYRALVEIHHPDRMQSMRPEVQERASARLKLINEAYQTLSNPEARARYDARLVGSQTVGQAAAASIRPGEARSKLRARLATLEREILQLSQQIQWLRPREQEMQRHNRIWDRYIFTSISLALPFLFLGIWASRLWASDPLAAEGWGGLGAMLLFDYLSIFIIAWVSGLNLLDIGLHRVALAVPAVVAVVLLSLVIGAPQTFRLLILLGGYCAIVWKLIGKRVASQRDELSITLSRIARLEEELYEHQVERRAIQMELARQ